LNGGISETALAYFMALAPCSSYFWL